VAQVEENLPSKCEALSSDPSTITFFGCDVSLFFFPSHLSPLPKALTLCTLGHLKCPMTR
jgi:hypothetical protein